MDNEAITCLDKKKKKRTEKKNTAYIIMFNTGANLLNILFLNDLLSGYRKQRVGKGKILTKREVTI